VKEIVRVFQIIVGLLASLDTLTVAAFVLKLVQEVDVIMRGLLEVAEVAAVE
jgi:hypothetical protein